MFCFNQCKNMALAHRVILFGRVSRAFRLTQRKHDIFYFTFTRKYYYEMVYIILLLLCTYNLTPSWLPSGLV